MFTFKDLSIKQKIGGGLIAFIVLFLVSFCIPLTSAYKTSGYLAEIKDIEMPQSVYGNELNAKVLQTIAFVNRSIANRAAAATSQAYMDSAWILFDAAKQRNAQLQKARTESNSQDLDKITYFLSDYESTLQKYNALTKQIDTKIDELEKIKVPYYAVMEQLRTKIGRGTMTPQAGERLRLVTENFRALESVKNNLDDEAAIKSIVTNVLANHKKAASFAGQYDMGAEVANAESFIKNYAASANGYFDQKREHATLFGRLISDANALNSVIERISSESMVRSSQRLDAADTSVSNIFIIAYTTAAIMLVVSLILLQWFSNITVKPIEKIENVITKLSEGDLTQNVEIDSNDEIGRMSEKLNQMSAKLREIVAKITVGAEDINTSGNEMSRTSQQMNEGATQQSASTEEISSAIEEMSAKIAQNSENAQQTERIADNALANIRLTNDASQESMEAMKNIAQKISIID